MPQTTNTSDRNDNIDEKQSPTTWTCMFCDKENNQDIKWCTICFPDANEPKSYDFGIFIQPKLDHYSVNYDHVKENVRELTDDLKIDDNYNAKKLLEIFDKIEISKDELSLWAGYGGYSLFNDKQSARSRFQTVIDFAEDNASCSKHVKQKLRIITKLIMEKGIEKSNEYVHILFLIASHGSVCNVMKEVAIGNAYGLMTDGLQDFIKKQSLEEQIKKVLRDFRVLLVEECFHSFKMTNNTHDIAGFHNVIADKIGVLKYNDPDISSNPYSPKCTNWKKNLDKRYFGVHYTRDRIVEHIIEQINEKKIGYQKIVKFMEDNCPLNMDKMEFLQFAIDIDNGKINKGYICWMLEKLNVFMDKSLDKHPIQKCWEDIKA